MSKPAETKSTVLILGNQLFDPKLIKAFVNKKEQISVFMREDQELCTYYKFHKHKIIFFLAAMRTYAEELKKINLKFITNLWTKTKQPMKKHC